MEDSTGVYAMGSGTYGLLGPVRILISEK